MLNFDFELSTQIHFGRGCIQGLPEEILKYGRRMFLIYDETSAKASGAYDEIRTLCKADGIKVIEFKQVKPKPRHTTVNEGVRMLKRTKADCIVALGGGSTIDLAKAMSFAVFHEGNCWDFYEKKVVVTRTVPVITIPTIAASGSEVSNVSIISNVEEKKKVDCKSNMERPVAAFIDPVYSFTVPKFETACGIISIMSHAYERYFTQGFGEIQDGISEAIQKSCIRHGRLAMEHPDSYESRAQLLWCASLAVMHLADCGRLFFNGIHYMEQTFSAFLDIPYGVSTAIVSLAWLKYIFNDETATRFARWGRNVWGICEEQDEYAVGKKAIERFEDFVKELHLPTCLSDLEIEASDSTIRQMAEKLYADTSGEEWPGSIKSKEELEEIFRLAL